MIELPLNACSLNEVIILGSYKHVDSCSEIFAGFAWPTTSSKVLECAFDVHFTMKRGVVNGTQLTLVGHVTMMAVVSEFYSYHSYFILLMILSNQFYQKVCDFRL